MPPRSSRRCSRSSGRSRSVSTQRGRGASSSSSRGSTPRARTARSAMSSPGVNPQGCRVTSFKAPTPVELAHDFLWRVHAECPARGMIGIFNRSHYEDVVTVGVLGLAPEEVWRRRPQRIVEFERLLADEGTTVLKCFLHVSAEEQQERFAERVVRSDQALEVQPEGRGDGAPLRRVHGGVRAGSDRDLDRARTLVRDPRRPQLGPEPRRRDGARRGAAAARSAVPLLVAELGERAARALDVGRRPLDVLQGALGTALSLRERLLRLGELPFRPASALLGPLVHLRLRRLRRGALLRRRRHEPRVDAEAGRGQILVQQAALEQRPELRDRARRRAGSASPCRAWRRSASAGAGRAGRGRARRGAP